MSLKFVCILKSGGDFNIEHVERLRSAIATYAPMNEDVEFVCLTDYDFDVRGITRIPLMLNLPGWWSMLEMFRIPVPAIYMDLDTTIRGSLFLLTSMVADMESNEVLALKPWNRGQRANKLIATGVTAWNCSMQWLFEKLRHALSEKRATHISTNETHGRLVYEGKKYKNDQWWTTEQLREKGYILRLLQDELPGFAQSYKKDLKKGKHEPTGSLVIYHGIPRPWDVERRMSGASDCKQSICVLGR